jgi:hypothetical protein
VVKVLGLGGKQSPSLLDLGFEVLGSYLCVVIWFDLAHDDPLRVIQ